MQYKNTYKVRIQVKKITFLPLDVRLIQKLNYLQSCGVVERVMLNPSSTFGSPTLNIHR